MKNELGKRGEELAALEYEIRGYRIIGQNVRVHGVRQIGEIDVIATREREIVFVEVKTRRSASFGSPAEAVDYFKRRKVIAAVKSFLHRNRQYDDWAWRIDVVEVDIDKRPHPAIILENVIEDLN
jgi:putative endonuclease